VVSVTKTFTLPIIQHVTDADEMVLVSGKANTHNCRIWGSENPHASLEHVCDGPKVNVFSTLSKERVYGLFFFMEMPITSIVICSPTVPLSTIRRR
jgi:hypothetical protein